MTALGRTSGQFVGPSGNEQSAELRVWAPWTEGDFFRPRRGYVHILVDVRDGVIVAACGRDYYASRCEPAQGHEPDLCAACWEAM